MSATTLSSQRDFPSQVSLSSTVENSQIEDRLCPGCKQSALTEHGGLVVAFGQSFFHVDCFKCAKCTNQVNADTNLLLLSDGSPICANCSYSCNVCHLPILDEAIMTGDDSYHAHCFKCKVCDTRIDELVFAKTSHGIYCMSCHNKRMIKLREHAQKKAERAKEKAVANATTSSKSREIDPRGFLENSLLSRHETCVSNSQSCSLQSISSDRISDSPTTPSIVKSKTGSNANELPSFTSQVPTAVEPAIISKESVSITFSSPSGDTIEKEPKRPPKQNALAVTSKHTKSNLDHRRRSCDDGGCSSNIQGSGANAETNRHPSGMVTAPLSPATPPGRDQRRSINPMTIPSVPPASPSVSLLNNTLAPKDSLLASTSRRDKRRSINPAALLLEGSPSLSSFSRSPNSPSHGRHLLSLPSEQNSPRHVSSSIEEQSNDELHSRFSASSRNNQTHDQTIVVKSLPAITVGSVPPSKSRLKAPGHEDESPPDQSFFSLSSRSLKTQERNDICPPPIADYNHTHPYTPTPNGRVHYSPIRPRTASPRLVDVPSGVESEMESDSEAHNSLGLKNVSSPHIPVKVVPLPGGPESDEMPESEPVERTSHPTFITPALPPIRISMSDADFQELLNSVGNCPPLNTLKHLTDIPENFPEGILASPSSLNFDDTICTSCNPPVPPKPIKPLVVPSRPGGTNCQSATAAPPSSTVFSTKGIPLDELASSPRITLEEADPSYLRNPPGDAGDVVIQRLRQVLAGARERGAKHLKIESSFFETIFVTMESQKEAYELLRSRFDGIKRTSKQFIEGLSVAQDEYDRELKARREAEAEVTRLRVLLSGQVARLTVMSGEVRKDEMRQRMSKELNASLTGLEQDLSNLIVERDMTLAEVEELSASRSTVTTSPDLPSVIVSRSLTRRFESIKNQYKSELLPLTKEKESLNREIVELKAMRDVFLEETTVLNARNEELVQLNAVYSRRVESIPASSTNTISDTLSCSIDRNRSPQQQSNVFPSLSTTTSISSTSCEDIGSDGRLMKVPKTDVEHSTPSKKFMKWPGSKSKELLSSVAIENKLILDHSFQQLSILRFTRCDHCGDKMWGSQLRCTACSTSIHARCIAHVQIPCAQAAAGRADLLSMPLPPPSMFGRTLADQVQADSRVHDEERHIPIIVEKCIDAVEALAMDYEGIYRKSGGSGQSKLITQLFERGNYNSFDLRDTERFNDICSVTSVLKNYFRSLPAPLLTFDLHEKFITAVHTKDPAARDKSLLELVKQLPVENFRTLEILMLHLHRIHKHSETNLMTARNLGVVFGPTLMRSHDPGAEFSDMAGKALSVGWLIENAPRIFNT